MKYMRLLLKLIKLTLRINALIVDFYISRQTNRINKMYV
jgi:hypothetical protein